MHKLGIRLVNLKVVCLHLALRVPHACTNFLIYQHLLPQNLATSSVMKSLSEPSTFAMLKTAGDAMVVEHPPHIDSKLKDDENPTKALSIASARDFDDISQDMSRLFEGRENEQNWDKRRKAIIKISRITHGNGPIEYRTQYTSFIKSQLDSILKVVDSLRTNATTTGLNTLQHIADALGPGVDFMVDFVVETLIARCCNTSRVKRDPAISTFETIISNATCNKNILHHIMSASEHKDPNARTAVSGWLMALLKKNGRHCDQAGILDLIEKCIKNGLNDAKPQVRTPMRATYVTYARIWPDRADHLRDGLDIKAQKMLDCNSTVESADPSLKQPPSIRDIKAARKKEMDAQEGPRPQSANSNRPSIKDIKAAKIREMKATEVVRPPSAQSARSSVRGAKTLKRQDAGTEDAVRPPSAQSTRPSNRETKIARKRDTGEEDVVHPPTAQTTRPTTRDVKSTRWPDAEAKDLVRPSSALSNNGTKRRDMEAQDSARPLSAQLHTTANERRFHILSSAPMRPQRGFVDLKRVVQKPGQSLQQQADAKTPPPLPMNSYRLAKQTDKRLHGPKNEALSLLSSKLAVSEQETTTKIVQIDLDGNETQTRVQDIAISSAIEIETAKPGVNDQGTGSDVSVALVGTPLEKHDEFHRHGLPSSKHDKTQTERSIEIHEDEASADQVDPAKGTRQTKRRSGGGMDVSKEGVKAPVGKGSFRSLSPPTALREIDQFNQTVEPVKRQENIRQKFISTETAGRNRSVSPHTKNPDKARKQLSRAIEKIRARTMDDYGYRRVQGLIKVHDALFDDEQEYDELFLALLDTLETPNTERRRSLGRQFDNKFQILVTIRLMLVHNPKYCAAYHPRALCALITARRNFDSRCHIVGGLEATAEDIVGACSPTDVTDPILDVLELQEQDDIGCRAISMGLHILTGLVSRIKGDEISDKTQEQRLTRFALRCLRNENSETRRATIAFCVEFRRLINPEERYFQMVAGNDEALKSLLTYFIATTHPR